MTLNGTFLQMLERRLENSVALAGVYQEEALKSDKQDYYHLNFTMSLLV